MNIAEETIEGYDLDVELTASSEAAMLTELERAINDKEPIVVTLWQPHWAFLDIFYKLIRLTDERI